MRARSTSQQESLLRSHRLQQNLGDDECSQPSGSSPKGLQLTVGGLFTLRTPTKRHRSAARAPPTAPCELAVLRLREAVGQDTLDAIEGTSQPADDVFLAKWLHSRGPEAAPEAIRRHADWRESFVGPNRLGIAESSIATELEHEKVFLQGIDAHGCALLLFLCSRHLAGAYPPEDTVRLLAYAIDNACAAANPSLNPERKVCCVFIMQGVKMRNIDAAFLRDLFELLQNHYPQCLSRLYFVDAPLIFLGVWRCVAPFINLHTRSKITFLSGVEGRRRLGEAVGPAVLPSCLGGSAALIPVDKAVARLRGCGERLPSSAGEESLAAAEVREEAAAARAWRAFFWPRSPPDANVGAASQMRSRAALATRGIVVLLFLVQLMLLISSLHTSRWPTSILS